MAALLRGVETRLRSSACLDDQPDESVGKFVGVQPDGQPPAFSGQWYYSVHSGGSRCQDDNALSLDEWFNVTVTIVARMAYSPRDRRGHRMTIENELLERARRVGQWLHQDDAGHRTEANKLIEGTAEYVAIHGGSATTNGFLTPLKAPTISEVKKCPPNWFGANETTEAYYVEIKMKDANRVQLLGS